ncbi:MAG TPA: ABC transporter permease [Microbacterium sp.]|nr:ABC transporter permease [Microbacterium sp.]
MSALDLARRPRVDIGADGAPAPRAARPAPPAAVLVSAAVLAVIALFVVWPGLFTSFDPVRSDVANSLQAPSAQHWFGTDRLGRDVWARVVYGARYSVLIGIAATAIGVVGGTIIGIGAGLSGAFVRGRAGRLLDEALTRVIDVLSSLPAILLAMLVVTFTGPGIGNIAVAIGIAGMPLYARVVRSQTMVVVRTDYVAHAAVYGRSRAAVLTEHVLPNGLTAVPVLAAIDIGTSILAVSGLSFLGLGPQPPTPEWGVMLSEARDILRIAPWAGIFPGLFITATVISVTVVGRWLQRAADRRIS